MKRKPSTHDLTQLHSNGARVHPATVFRKLVLGKAVIVSLLLVMVGVYGLFYGVSSRVYADPAALEIKYSVATGSADIIVGAGKSIKTEFGPLNFSAKSGFDTYGTGMVLTPAGNVGIGTAGPTGKAHVYGAGTAYTAPLLYVQSTGDVAARIETADTGTSAISKLQGFDASLLFKNIDSTVNNWSLISFAAGNTAAQLAGAGIGAQHVTQTAPYKTDLAFFTSDNGDSGLAERMRILNNGNVGIGTTGPNDQLELLAINDGSGIRLTGSQTATTKAVQYSLYDGTTQRSTLSLASVASQYSTSAAAGDIVLRANTGKLILQTGTGAGSMIINGGNVGIGTTSPSVALDVVGSASSSATLTVGNGGTIRPQFGPLTLAYKSDLNAWTSGVTLQDTTGNVGIGTTTPAQKLSVAGTIESTTGGVKFPDGSTQTAAAAGETAGQIAFFAAACPSGWTEYTALRGRVAVGTPLSGTTAGTVGTALTNLQDPTHTHTGPSHTHGGGGLGFRADSNGSSWGSMDGPYTVQFTSTTGNWWGLYPREWRGETTAAGTGATSATSATMPYIQLTACQKN